MSTTETLVPLPEEDWLDESSIGEYVIVTFSPKSVVAGYIDDFAASDEDEDNPEPMRDTMLLYGFDEWGLLRRYEIDTTALSMRRQSKIEHVPSRSLGRHGLTDWLAATLSTQYGRETQLVETDCANLTIHEMHEWSEGRYCTGRGTDFYALSPSDLRDRLHLDPEDLRQDALFYYLGANPKRTERGFHALWTRWASGKSNMPLAVSSALTKPNPGSRLETLITELLNSESRNES